MGFGVWALGFGVWGLGFGLWGLGFGVWGLGFGVWGLWFYPPPWSLRRSTTQKRQQAWFSSLLCSLDSPQKPEPFLALAGRQVGSERMQTTDIAGISSGNKEGVLPRCREVKRVDGGDLDCKRAPLRCESRRTANYSIDGIYEKGVNECCFAMGPNPHQVRHQTTRCNCLTTRGQGRSSQDLASARQARVDSTSSAVRSAPKLL